MTAIVGIGLGALLAAGLLLVASPWLWPATGQPTAGRRWYARVQDRLVQAGAESVQPVTFLGLSVLVGAIAAAAAFLVTAVPMAALLAGMAASALPWTVLSARARQRRRSLRLVWPDAVDHLVAAIRSGAALPEALASLGSDGPEALRPAFSAFAQRHARTAHFGSAIDGLKDQLADPTADRIMESLRMAREVGGSDLVHVLNSLARGLREDQVIRSEVEGRQSWLVNAARIGVAAPWITLVILSTRPEAAESYRSPAGAVLLIAALGVTVVAYRLMMFLGRLPEDERWLR